jgi:hypothetical protein
VNAKAEGAQQGHSGDPTHAGSQRSLERCSQRKASCGILPNALESAP